MKGCNLLHATGMTWGCLPVLDGAEVRPCQKMAVKPKKSKLLNKKCEELGADEGSESARCREGLGKSRRHEPRPCQRPGRGGWVELAARRAWGLAGCSPRATWTCRDATETNPRSEKAKGPCSWFYSQAAQQEATQTLLSVKGSFCETVQVIKIRATEENKGLICAWVQQGFVAARRHARSPFPFCIIPNGDGFFF